MEYGIRKIFGLTFSVKFRIYQSIIQNIHFKKSILDLQICNRNMNFGFRNP